MESYQDSLNNVFLSNKHIFVGIGPNGSHGTTWGSIDPNTGQTADAGYTFDLTGGSILGGQLAFDAVGFVDLDYSANIVKPEFFLPGTPEERFVVGWIQNGITYNNSNGRNNITNFTDNVVTNMSDVNKLKAKYTGYSTTEFSTGNDYNIVISKIDQSGNTLWVSQDDALNTNSDNNYPSVATDSSNNIIVAFYNEGGVILGGTSFDESYDIVLAKFDSSGNFLWARQDICFNTIESERYPWIGIDSKNNIIMTFETRNGTVQGGTNNDDSYDVVISKFNPNGDLLWIKQDPIFTTASDDERPKLKIDNNDNIIVVYYSNSEVSGGNNAGNNDIIVLKLDSSGNLLWAKQDPSWNTSLNDELPIVSVDSFNNIIFCYFCEGVIEGGTQNQLFDIVVVKLDSSGNLIWAKQDPIWNTDSEDENPSLIVDHSDNIIFAYSSSSTVTGGNNAGNNDIIVVKLDSSGDLIWARQDISFNTEYSEYRSSIAVDNYNNIYVVYDSYGQLPDGNNLDLDETYDIILFKLDTCGNFIWAKQDACWNSIEGDTDYRPTIAFSKDNTIVFSYQTRGTVKPLPEVLPHSIKTEILYSFGPTQRFLRVDVSLTNVSGSILQDVRFMRNFDPDQGSALPDGGGSTTFNKIILQNGYDEFNATNTVHSFVNAVNLGPELASPICFASFDNRSTVAAYGFSNGDTFEPYLDESNFPPGYTIEDDGAILILFKFGNLNPGQSVYFTYYVGFGDVNTILGEIGGGSIGDPLITPVLGKPYFLPNDENTYLLFDNRDNLKIFGKCWLPFKSHPTKMSYFKYFIFHFDSHELILDVDSLEFVEFNKHRFYQNTLQKSYSQKNINIDNLIINYNSKKFNRVKNYYSQSFRNSHKNKQMELIFNIKDYSVKLYFISDLGYPDLRNNIDFSLINVSDNMIKEFDGAYISKNKCYIVKLKDSNKKIL